MDKREEIQNTSAQHILTALKTILFISIRLGKTRIGLKAIEAGDRVLIIHPLVSLKKTWLDELKKFTPLSTDITFVTKASVHKYKDQHFDYVIVDEPQLCQSMKQLIAIKSIRCRKFVGLTGTLSPKTTKLFKEFLNWNIGFTYTIEDAIKDGLVKDYEIFVHYKPLDDIKRNVAYTKFGKEFYGTEQEVYDTYTDTMEYFKELEESAGDRESQFKCQLGYKKFMGLRTNFLYNTQSLLDQAMWLINRFKDDKVLIYTLRTDIADSLSTISYHSKNKEEDQLEYFKTSLKGHMASVNCIQAGITIENVNKVVYHAYESNPETFFQKLGRSLLWQYAGEKSQTHICCSQGTQMETWIERACTSLDQNKIKYVINGKVYSKLGYIKMMNPDKSLFLYNGSVVYYSHTVTEGFPFKHYGFVGSNSDKTYSLSDQKLVSI